MPPKSETYLITGAAGFIGSCLARYLIRETDARVVVVDKLTYAGSLTTLDEISSHDRFVFERADITDAAKMERIFTAYKPDGVFHLAAESHVDRSIGGPADFIQTNIVGTYVLLEAALNYWRGLAETQRKDFRFLHVSTDEVYGELGDEGKFEETTPYDPSSPYSASKAASDHLVRAWHRTYGLPTLVTNCSNNYGPYQYPEKLIPVVILRALEGRKIPVYGKGENVRDWLYVGDHVTALVEVIKHGRPGETYNIGGNSERKNIDVVRTICRWLDEIYPDKHHEDLIEFVPDRPGHDWRYAIDATKISNELGWEPSESFESGMRHTVDWYIANRAWCEHVLSVASGTSK